MPSSSAAGASEPLVARTARDWLRRGNAVDAVVAGVLVAAAETPSVFLGPFQLLVAGAGAGLQAIDGRVRQPGLRAPRPRGFLADEAIPPSARVGVPALPAAVALALASLGSATSLRVASPAIERARSRSAERAAVIESFARRGASALVADSFAGELIGVAGRSARGMLTKEDLASVRPAVQSCDERALDPSGILVAPWRDEHPEGTWTHVVAAADSRGLVAIACYEAPPSGLDVSALGLVAPAFASPVLRGQPRLRPARACAAAAPIAIRVRGGVADLALGIAGALGAEASLGAVIAGLDEVSSLPDALARATLGRPVAVERDRRTARAVPSA